MSINAYSRFICKNHKWNNPNVHQQVDRQATCYILAQWNTIPQQKGKDHAISNNTEKSPTQHAEGRKSDTYEHRPNDSIYVKR